MYVVLNVGKMPDLTVCADDTNQYNYSIVGIGDLVLLGERMHDEQLYANAVCNSWQSAKSLLTSSANIRRMVRDRRLNQVAEHVFSMCTYNVGSGLMRQLLLVSYVYSTSVH